MSKLGSWSTTAGNNNATPPDGWPEGQAPSTVNDCARELMAQIRTYVSDAQYFDPANTPSFVTATTFSLGTSDVTTFHVGRRIKLFDSTTLYGTIDSVSATLVSVRLDSGALTASLSSVAVAALTNTNNSLPEVAWRRNILINGSLDVWERGNGPFQPANATLTYTADRFNYLQSAAAACSITRAERSANAANVPTIAQAGVFLNSSLRVSVSAIDAAIAATDFAAIGYRVEGFDWRQIAHKRNILSFWVNTNRSGTYCVAFRNAGQDNAYVSPYVMSAINTWTHFSLTVPEAPTTGTWDYSTGVGLEVTFALAAGTTLQTAATTWTASNVIATSAQVNFLASAGNVFQLAGMQLEAGSYATPLEIRPYHQELALARRYYWRGLPISNFNFPAYTTGAIMSWACKYPQSMRVTPSVNTVMTGIALTGLAGNPSIVIQNTEGFRLLTSASGANTNAHFIFGASDYFEFDAEL